MSAQGLVRASLSFRLAFLGCAFAALAPWRLALADSPTRSRQGDRPHDRGQVVVFDAGRATGTTTREGAEARGLVVVDLRDAWTPFLLAPDDALGAEGAQPYVETYRALAAQQFGEGEDFDRARTDRFLELYGITPTFTLLTARLTADARHACLQAIDDAPLAAAERVIAPYGDPAARAADVELYRRLTVQLARSEATRDTSQPMPPWLRMQRRRLAQVAGRVEPVLAVQAHLRCEGLLSSRAVDGVYEPYAVAALSAYQRLHMVPSRPGFLDAPTRAVFLEDSRELDFQAVLRALRERVVDATGLIEDGSAGAAWGTVLGRTLEAAEFRAFASEPPLPDAAPDLISPATEAAARALGWTSFDATRAFFDAHRADAAGLLVAVSLPPPPDYHRPHMELRAALDRGDVWYDFPYTATGQRVSQAVTRRPRIVLYARDGDRERALVRWPTTIGGWQTEQLPGGRVGLRYKNSDVGPRVWRDLVASPAWLPPPTTPDEDLVRRDSALGWRVKRDAFGPGFASAYGLAMLIQHVVLEPREEGDVVRYFDRGIRTHGSASYASILRGMSHGCHRLFNHLALRLADFLLAHRDHVRHGPEPVRYLRRFGVHGHSFELRIDSRGVRTELVPPVPMEVLVGEVHGRAQSAPEGMRPLPSALAARARAASAAAEQ